MTYVYFQRAPSKRTVFFLAVLLFIVAFSIYFPRTAEFPQDADGAEYAAAAVTGSIVHPPGYPVYMSLARPIVEYFDANPYNSLAIFSAVCQAIAVSVIFLIGIEFGFTPLLPFVVALTWAIFGPTIKTATDVEVFAFHHLLLAASIFIALKLQRASNTNLFLPAIFGLLLGLASAHHQTIILWAPFFIWIVLSRLQKLEKFIPSISELLLIIIGYLAGLSAYVSLLHDYVGAPILAFAPPATKIGLLNYIFRTDYGTFSLTTSGVGPAESYLLHFIREVASFAPFTLVVLPLVILFFSQRNWPKFFAYYGTLLLHGMFGYLLILPGEAQIAGEWISRFYPLILFLLCFLLFPVLKELKLSKSIEYLIVIGLIAPALSKFDYNLSFGDAAHDYATKFEIEQTLDELPADSVYIAASDRISIGMVYTTAALKRRDDITVIVLGLLGNKKYRAELAKNDPVLDNFDGVSPLLKQVVQKVAASGRYVFSNFGTQPPEGYKALPIGISWQWIPEDMMPPRIELTKKILARCASWPTDLGVIPRARVTSRKVMDSLFLWPLENHIELLNDSYLERRFKGAIRAFHDDDISLARKECLRGYKKITGSDFIPKPIPY